MDFGYNMLDKFYPDCRLYQLEYALKAAQNGETVIGLRGKDGVVLAAEKLLFTKLQESEANRRILSVDDHIGMGFAGLVTDARHVVDVARLEASNYRHEYDLKIPLRCLGERISEYMHTYASHGSERPYGCSVILIGYDDDGYDMYIIDPASDGNGIHSCAIGRGKEDVKLELMRLAPARMTCRELINEATKIMYLLSKEPDKFELELVWNSNETKGLLRVVPGVLVSNAIKCAKQCIGSLSTSSSDESDDSPFDIM